MAKRRNRGNGKAHDGSFPKDEATLVEGIEVDNSPLPKPQMSEEQKALAVSKPRNGKKTEGKLSEAEVLLRLRCVEQALVDGKRGIEVIEYLSELLNVTITYTTLNEYVRRVRDKWEQEDKLLRPIWRERQMRKLHSVAKKIEEREAWGHWVAVQRLIADLEGNLAPSKVEHSVAQDPFDNWTLDELRRFIDSNGKVIPKGKHTSEGFGQGEHDTLQGRANHGVSIH